MKKDILQLRKTKSFIGDKEYYEIIKWYPNPLYNKKKEYIPQGDGSYKHPEFNFYCYEESFKKKYCCYTICYFIYNEDDNEVILKIVGDRILDEGVDWNLLRSLIEAGFKKARELYNINSEEDETD